jgi:hypothetical protein
MTTTSLLVILLVSVAFTIVIALIVKRADSAHQRRSALATMERTFRHDPREATSERRKQAAGSTAETVASGDQHDGYGEQQAPAEQPAPQQPDVLSSQTIFISYDRDDWDEFVQPLVIDLRQRGFKVWIDQLSIRRGSNWVDAIQEALDTCERMVLCVSPNSMQSARAKDEYRYFLSMNKTVIPLVLRQARTPYDLASIQFISYEDRDVLIQELGE